MPFTVFARKKVDIVAFLKSTESKFCICSYMCISNELFKIILKAITSNFAFPFAGFQNRLINEVCRPGIWTRSGQKSSTAKVDIIELDVTLRNCNIVILFFFEK